MTVPSRSDATLALAPLGEREEAHRLAAEELELAESFGARRASGIAQRALVLAGDADATLPGLERAVATLREFPAALDLAIATVDLASAQRRAGQRSHARETATRAQDLAMTCGATLLARRALEEALAVGARPRRVARRGVESLTPSELRVAWRAAEGYTNCEIAQDLFERSRPWRCTSRMLTGSSESCRVRSWQQRSRQGATRLRLLAARAKPKG